MEPDRNAQETGRANGRWMRRALFASLALNLLVVGLVSGALIKGPPERHGRGPSMADAVMPYTRAFDDDDKQALRHMMRETGPRRPDFGPLVDDYRQAVALLRADPFEPDRFVALLEAQSARTDVRRRVAQQALGDFVAELSPQARAAYADRLEQEVSALAARVPAGPRGWHDEDERHNGDDSHRD